jgi:hypothetical protein
MRRERVHISMGVECQWIETDTGGWEIVEKTERDEVTFPFGWLKRLLPFPSVA